MECIRVVRSFEDVDFVGGPAARTHVHNLHPHIHCGLWSARLIVDANKPM